MLSTNTLEEVIALVRKIELGFHHRRDKRDSNTRLEESSSDSD